MQPRASTRRAVLIGKMATQRSPPSDVYAALANFTALKLYEPQPYFFPDGKEQHLFFLEGTIPVFMGRAQYDVPITIWLRQNHPQSPPIVYVRVESGKTIVKTSNVDVDGKVDVEYLSEWNSSSELSDLIQILCFTFSEQYPLYSSSQAIGPSKQSKDIDSQSKFTLDFAREVAFEQGLGEINTKLLQLPQLPSSKNCFSKTEKNNLEKPLLPPFDVHPNDRAGEISSAKILDSSSEEDNEDLEKKLLSSDDEFPLPPIAPAQNQMGVSHIQQQTQQMHLGYMPPHQLHHVPQGPPYPPQPGPMPAPSARPPSSSSQLRAFASQEGLRLDLNDFSWEFIGNSKTCDICMESMIEPNLLQCCGNAYLCRRCVEQCRKRAMPCPLCKRQAFSTLVDRNYQSVIQRSRVWCPCRENGCRWSGLFQDAEVHLQGCGFRVVSCPNHCIDVKLQQRFMEEHLNGCPLQPIPCPYTAAGCNEQMPRKNIPLHSAYNIHQHLLQIAGKNHSVSQGCKAFEQYMEDMYARIETTRKEKEIENLKQKLSQTKRDILRLEDKIREAHVEIQQLHEQQEQSNGTLINILLRKGEKLNSLGEAQDALLNQFRRVQTPNATYAPEVPTVFTLDHFSERKANNEQWISPPFYTHTGGYKLRLSVYPNGNAEEFGKSVSIYLHLTRGEFDDHLQWPMPEFHLQALLKNQRFFVVNLMDKPRSANLRKNFDWDDATTIDMRYRVGEAGIGSGWGVHRWISHANLGRYLTNDSLCIQVHRITFLPH